MSVRTCPGCAAPRRMKGRINHVLHLLLTVFTVGLWAPVWLVVAACSVPRCEVCGVAG